MKYALVPLKECSIANADAHVLMPACIINFISAIIVAIVGTERFLPNLHGWGRFWVCIATILGLLVLTFAPVIGPLLCIAAAIFWIIQFWVFFGGIPWTWLKWTLRVFVTLFIGLAETVPIILAIC